MKGVAPVDLNHWRYWRMMDTILFWGKKPDGYRQSGAPTPLSRSGGWVALRSAMAILFDYEKKLIDYAVEMDHLFYNDKVHRKIDIVIPRCVCITNKGLSAMKEWADRHKECETNGNTAKKIIYNLESDDLSEYSVCDEFPKN